MKRILWSAAVIPLVCGVAWLFGFDFNERGTNAGFVALWSIMLAIFVYACPLWRMTDGR